MSTSHKILLAVVLITTTVALWAANPRLGDTTGGCSMSIPIHQALPR